MRDKIIAAFKRAGWTAAEVAIALIPAGARIEEVAWTDVLSVVAVATILSLLKSIIAGMPEVDNADHENGKL